MRRKRSFLEKVAYRKDSLFDVNPETKKGILIVLVLLFGALGFLSIFDLAGTFGVYYNRGLSYVFGWGKIIFPVALLALGYFLYNEGKYYVRGSNYLGLILFFLTFFTFLALLIPESERIASPTLGQGGGYLGVFLASVFIKLMGFWATLIVALSLLVVSLMLIFNSSLNGILGRNNWFLKPFYFLGGLIAGRKGEKEQEGDGEDEEEVSVEVKDDESEDGEDEEEDFAVASGIMAANKPKIESDIWKKSNIKIDLPMNLLSAKIGKPMSGDVKSNGEIIKTTLDDFGISVEMGEVNVGPTVTQYTFKPDHGVKVAKITNLSNDLALALAAHPIRIEAPIPGRSLVGIEVPNQTKAIVGLREILESKDFKARKTNLTIALGKDVSGKPWSYDITKMPHLLVAGATGSGKSVCLNSIIVSLLYQNNPDDLRFIMVDPKRVELPIYNGIPHLLTTVITEVDKTINALKWCLNEMDRRFDILARAKKRNILSYNESGRDKMPYLVFIIDELADLMVVAARDVETAVIRLAQMARAVGIHLVLATQRPSVDVITGLIKANMPARIAFSVASSVDSRTILDSLGAEKLLGSGDMLFTTAELSKPKRIQGAYVSDQEIKRIVRYIKEKSGEPEYIEGVTDRQKVRGIAGVGMDGGADDELFDEAREIVINSGKASTSLLQRRLSVGYGRAAKLIDMMEEAGIIGPANGARPREVLITKEQYAAMAGAATSGVPLHNREESAAPDEYLPGSDSDETTGVPPVLKNEDGEGEEETEETVEEGGIEEELVAEGREAEEAEEADETDEEEGGPEETTSAAETGFKKKKIEGEPEEEKKNDPDDFDEDDGMFFAR